MVLTDKRKRVVWLHRS